MLLVATTRENVSPSLVLELLKRIGGIIKVTDPLSLTPFLSSTHHQPPKTAPPSAHLYSLPHDDGI